MPGMTLTTWPPFTRSHNGVHLRGRDSGETDRPVALLLHGVSDNGACWGRTADFFHDHGYRVLCPDQRAHGRSDAPEDGYLTRDYVADALAVLDYAGAERAVIAGHSFGGRVAMHLAASAPHRVARLILLDPALGGDAADDTPEQTARARYDFFAWLREAKSKPIDQLIREQRALHPGWREDEYIAHAESKHQCSSRIWGRTGIEWMPPWRDALARITAPTLLLRGESRLGGIVPEERLPEISALNPRLEIITIAGAGHDLHRDHFAAVAGVVLQKGS